MTSWKTWAREAPLFKVEHADQTLELCAEQESLLRCLLADRKEVLREVEEKLKCVVKPPLA